MHSGRPSSPFFYIFTSFILISVPPSFCSSNEYNVNGKKPSQFLNIQGLHRLLDSTVLLPPPPAPPPDEYCRSELCYRIESPMIVVNAKPKASPSQPNTVVAAPQPNPSRPIYVFGEPQPSPPQPKTDSPTPSLTPSSISPPPKSDPLLKRKLLMAIAIASAVLGIVLISSVIIYTIKRGHLSTNKMVCWERGTRNYPFDDEEMMKNFGSMVPKRYTYSEVKKITNSFKNKLGKGGYGTVYKGKLPDAHLVAVKVLNESKGNGEEFINEVASISRTSHINIVNLVGFCYERSKRALIYEFMPNGSLDQFIYNRRSSLTTYHLDKKTMFRISVGIARGLEYLHSGCRTRILHFDIKPHNVLLDEDLCPKISDFGLAKLCKRKESIVSMMDMRGTIGYIAPEVFSRNFGAISHKSDVYSYGMLILEMIGGRKNFDCGVSQSSERDFSHWIYKKLQEGKIFDTCGEVIEEEEEEEDMVKKMILVGLWCIQTNPYHRPSIRKVIEMLEGTLQSIQFPPKPFLDSPPRSPPESSATSYS